MGLLTNTFHLISTALLIPVMLALLWYLMRVLLSVGQVLREHVRRLQARQAWAVFMAELEEGGGPFPELPPDGPVAGVVSRLVSVAHDTVRTDKVLREQELAWQRDLEQLRVLVRNGPALGLMGTLIPLGPALVGLAAGDIQSMADNLIIAFATTVVGLLVAMVGGGLLSVKKAWYQGDELLVHFALERYAQCAASRRAQPAALLQPVARPSSGDHGGNGDELAAVGVQQEDL